MKKKAKMKILSVTWAIYDDRLKEFSLNCTGGGLVVRNICEYIGRKEESYLLIGCCSLPSIRLGHINIIDTVSFAGIESKPSTNEDHVRAMVRAFESTLSKIKPTIVNVHGIGELSKICVEICIARGVPCVYTEHLYIGLNSKIIGYDRAVLWENEMYSIPGIQVIAVSTGMKKKVMKDFPQIPEMNIHVIKNGTDFKADFIKSNIKEKYAEKEEKILLCVGTVLARKNQCQLVEAFQLLPRKIQDDIKIVFCGRDGMKGNLQNEIQKAGLGNKLIYAGAFSSEEMKKFYSIADGLVMPSLAEGLSIAALEMLAYGKPVIMFSDSECADDLNDEQVTCFAKIRTSQSLAEAIVKWYEKEWDSEYIKKYVKLFSMENMAENYIDYYNHLLVK